MIIKFPGTRSKRHIFFILVVGLAVYFICLFHDFVGDDNALFLDNNFYHSFSNITRIFKPSYNTSSQDIFYGFQADKGSGSVAYRPVLTLTYFLDHALSGQRPFVYHLTNVLLHLLNSVMAYFLMIRLFDPRVAFMAAFLFCLHPLQSEAVANIGYRADLLFSFFVLISVLGWFHSREGKKWGLWMSLSGYFMALFSKETAILLPVWLLYAGQIYFADQDRRKIFLHSLGFLLIAAFFLWAYFIMFPNTALGDDPLAGPWLDRVTIIIQIWGIYLKYMALPFLVHPMPGLYFPPAVPLSSPVFWLPFLCLGAFIGTCIFLVWKRSKWGAAALWLIIFFLPASSLIPTPNPMAARYLYLPGLGFYVLMSGGLLYLIRHPSLRTISSGSKKFILCIAACFCAVSTFYNTASYKNNFSYGYAVSRKYPDFFLGHMLMGSALFSIRAYQGALEHYERAYRDPRCTNENVPYLLGLCHVYVGHYEEARAIFEKMIRDDPSFIKPYYGLGAFYFFTEDYEKAARYFELASSAGYPEAFMGLVRTYRIMGDLPRLSAVMTKARELFGAEGRDYKVLEKVYRNDPIKLN